MQTQYACVENRANPLNELTIGRTAQAKVSIWRGRTLVERSSKANRHLSVKEARLIYQCNVTSASIYKFYNSNGFIELAHLLWIKHGGSWPKCLLLRKFDTLTLSFSKHLLPFPVWNPVGPTIPAAKEQTNDSRWGKLRNYEDNSSQGWAAFDPHFVKPNIKLCMSTHVARKLCRHSVSTIGVDNLGQTCRDFNYFKCQGRNFAVRLLILMLAVLPWALSFPLIIFTWLNHGQNKMIALLMARVCADEEFALRIEGG